MNNAPSYLESLSIESCPPTGSWCPPANWEDVLHGERLATNDVYRNDNNGQRLVMENGDSLKISKDGKMIFSFTADCPQIDACGGAFKVTYPNGDRISFDGRGLQAITRGRQTVTFVAGRPTSMELNWLPNDRRVLN